MEHFFNSDTPSQRGGLRDCVMAVRATVDQEEGFVVGSRDPVPLIYVFVELCRCVSFNQIQEHEEPAKKILDAMGLALWCRYPSPLHRSPPENSRRLCLSRLIPSIESLPFGRGSGLFREIQTLCNPGPEEI